MKSNEKLVIRQANLDDADDGQAVVELLDMYAENRFGQSQPLSPETRAKLIPGLSAAPGCRVLLAFLDSRAVGITVGFPGFSTFRGMPLFNIHDVAVRPEARGYGIGRAMLAAFERAAMDDGCCRITLEVRSDNHVARRLYEDFGFETGNAEENEHLFFSKDLNGHARC